MTFMYHIFSSYCVCLGGDQVCFVNGSLSFVVGTGFILLTSSFPLSYVFHVPNFKLNIVFVNHITKTLNCSVTFFPFILCFLGLEDKKDDW